MRELLMKKLWNWLFPPKRKIVLIRRFSSHMTLDEYRSSPELVSTAKKFLMDPEFIPILETLRNESPANMSLFGVSIEERAFMQARIEGYQMVFNNLEKMAMPPKEQHHLESTYEQPENDMP